MDPASYNRLVKELEALARTQPVALRRGALAFVALGYVYVGAVLLVVAGLGVAIFLAMVAAEHGNLAGVKVGFALLALAWIIAKALWIRVTPPTGTPLVAGAAPLLDRRLEEIRAALDAPKPDVVLLTMEFNAAVVQIPRFGIFGFPKTYLQLGVPLMCGTQPREFDAILAHEFAHLSKAHPKTGLWVFRIGRTWQQLLTQFDESHSHASWLFSRFCRWYVPRLRARGFAMSRRDEYEADAEAGAFAGAAAMAAALVALEVRGAAVADPYWTEVWRGAETQTTPPDGVWTLFSNRLRTEPVTAPSAAKALVKTTLDHDTHPSLSERLRALGMSDDAGIKPHLELQASIAMSAAEHYLAAHASRFLADADREWQEDVRDRWSARHRELADLRARAERLLEDDRNGTLDSADTWELACALTDLEDDATPYLRRVVAEAPDNAGAQFLLGRNLLAANDEAGVEHIRAAMKLEIGSVGAGTELLRQFYTGRDATHLEAVQWDQHRHAELMRAAAPERNTVTARDTLLPIELSTTDVTHLRDVANQFDELDAMWVARKQTKNLVERPMIVIVAGRRGWRWQFWGSKNQELANAVVHGISLSFDADLLVLALGSNAGWLHRKVKKVDGALVFQRH
jgi:Zn-dependent protease with chaperone function